MGLKFKEFFELVTEARRYSGEYVVDSLEPYKDDPDVYISFTHDLGGPKLGINPSSKYSTPLGIYAYPVKAMWEDIKNNNIPFAGDRENIWVFKPKYPNKIVYASKFKMEDVYKAFKDKIVDLKPIDYINGSDEKKKKLFFKIVKKLTPDLKKIVAKIIKSTAKSYDLTDIWAPWNLFMKYQLLYLQPKHNMDLRAEYDFDINEKDRNRISFMFKYENAELKYLDENGHFNDEKYFDGTELTSRISTKHQKNPAQIFMSIARYMATENPIKWAKEMLSTGYVGIVDDVGSSIIHTNEPKQAVFFRLRDLQIIKLIKHKPGSNWKKPFDLQNTNQRALYETCVKFLKHKKFTILPDGRVNIDASLSLDGEFERFPFPIATIDGSLKIVNAPRFISFGENGPQSVEGDILINRSGLETLENFPKKVSGGIGLAYNNLKSLEGLPEKVQVLSVAHNQLTTLKGCSKIISNGAFNCSNNKLRNFIGGPEKIKDSKYPSDIVYYGTDNPLEIDMSKSLPVEGLPRPNNFYIFQGGNLPPLYITKIYKAKLDLNIEKNANDSLWTIIRTHNAVINDPKLGECLAVVSCGENSIQKCMFNMQTRRPVYNVLDLSAVGDSLKIVGELE